MFEVAFCLEGAEGSDQDRLAVIQETGRVVIALADGAGGIGGGREAAENAVAYVRETCPQTVYSRDWIGRLHEVDQRVAPGETTVTVADIRPEGIGGASVGDSRVWLIRDGEIDDLTILQHRKPLAGSGAAKPVGFASGPLSGLLLAASDGLLNYIKRDHLLTLVEEVPFPELPRALVEAVRLPSGGLWDDIAIAVCRGSGC